MVVSGLPIRNGSRHAGEIADLALHLLNALTTFKVPDFPDYKLQLRIGLHSGKIMYNQLNDLLYKLNVVVRQRFRIKARAAFIET